MAVKANKNSENVPGKFYIDSECSACGVCSDDAPASIKLNDDESHAYVYKQPTTPEEEEQLRAAMANCPTESIGDDA